MFDERRKIERDISAAAAFLTEQHLSGEIIVVDDGSRDGTAAIARQVKAPVPVRVLSECSNRGKGYAVRTGIAASAGDYVLFADSGLTVPFVNALPGLDLLQKGFCDIAHGSRKLPGSQIMKPQDLDRKLFSRLFKQLMISCVGVPAYLSDTQCGFKLYPGDLARQLYQDCIIDGFMFDIEVILRARGHGYRICEFPVQWTCDRDSRISLLRTPWHILFDLFRIKKLQMTGAFLHKPSPSR